MKLIPVNTCDETNSDDGLYLNKTIEAHNMIIVARANFHENNKYYECLYKF